jgi:hypothetical protein
MRWGSILSSLTSSRVAPAAASSAPGHGSEVSRFPSECSSCFEKRRANESTCARLTALRTERDIAILELARVHRELGTAKRNLDRAEGARDVLMTSLLAPMGKPINLFPS